MFKTALGEQHDRTVKCVKRLAALYDAWHAAEPDQGHADKAAEYRAKLPNSEEPTSTPP